LALHVRTLTDDENETVKRQAHSRTEPARVVERAKIIWLSQQGLLVPAIAKELHLKQQTVRLWLKRFNTNGLVGLRDNQRAGRPGTYTSEQIGEVIATALTNPKTLSLPFASWTLDRLEAYLNDSKNIAIKRSRIDDILIAEGLRWRKQETWFSERVDPDFAEKGGHHSPLHRATSQQHSRLPGRDGTRVSQELPRSRGGPST
jgi:transposase